MSTNNNIPARYLLSFALAVILLAATSILINTSSVFALSHPPPDSTIKLAQLESELARTREQLAQLQSSTPLLNSHINPAATDPDTTSPPTADTVLAKKLVKLETELSASARLISQLKADASSALRDENAQLKAQVAFGEDLAYYSMKLWSEAASRRAWSEYSCVGPPEPDSPPDVIRAWAGFEQLQPKCGCIYPPEELAYKPRTCTGRAPASCVAASPSAPLWVLFAGDSTMRQLFEQSEDTLTRHYQCINPAHLNKTKVTLHNAFDDEARYTAYAVQGARFLHEWDSELVCVDRVTSKPVVVLSYRSHQGLSPVSKMLSMLRRPHTHRVTASVMPKGWFFNTILPVLDEPYFVEVPWTVERVLGVEKTLNLQRCGPRFLLVGSALWDTSNWLGSVEKERCGMAGAAGTSEKLFPRRVAATLNEACRQFGSGSGRFVWRTSNRGNSRFRKMPPMNRLAKDMARQAGFRVMDYEALHESVGYPIRDHAHPPNFLTLRGAATFWRYVMRTVENHQDKDVAHQVLADFEQRLPAVASEWGKPGDKKLASEEELELERLGRAKWDVQ